VFNNTIQSQTYSQKYLYNSSGIDQKIYATLAAGLHWGDSRLIAKPSIFVGLGYYLSNSLSFKIEFTSVIVKIKNNNYPLFRYEGIELHEGDKAIIDEFFISLETKIYSNLWFSFGIAPEKLFSMRTGLIYNKVLSNNLLIYLEYNILFIGRPFLNSKNDQFINNLFLVGLKIFPF
jgi:hypothetical protein